MEHNQQTPEVPNLSKKERRELRRQEKFSEQGKRSRKRLLTRITIWLAVFFLVAGSIFGVIKFVSNSSDEPDQPGPLVGAISDKDWIKGNVDSDVVLIEYSDFQCPACAAYNSLLKRLVQEFENDIQFAYRHFPLKQIHKNAELAARAAEAAGRQGKFWEMHDLIFEKQKEWSSQGKAGDVFVSYARLLSIDLEQFANDLNSEEVKEKVEGDYQSGISSRVNSTPSFFLNGQKIKNPRNYDEFRDLIVSTLQ